MRRFILTGAPGAGKTSILHALRRQGYAVVEEAATDVIAGRQAAGDDEPWTDPSFIDRIAETQRRRQQEPAGPGADVQIYDRSPLCTQALAVFLGHPVSPRLAREIARVTRERVYELAVFFVRPLGFIEPTAARRISYPDSLAFERLHEAVYAGHGFEIIEVPAAGLAERAAMIADYITART